jgi:hypothetical protein
MRLHPVAGTSRRTQPAPANEGAEVDRSCRYALGLRRCRSVGHELIDVPVWSPEMLPRGSRFTEQLDTGLLKFVDSRLQVTHSEADNWTGTEVLLAWVAAAKYLDVAAIGQFKDPEIRFGMYQPESKNVLVEVRQFSRTIGTRAAPTEPCDFHICQYRPHLGGMARS